MLQESQDHGVGLSLHGGGIQSWLPVIGAGGVILPHSEKTSEFFGSFLLACSVPALPLLVHCLYSRLCFPPVTLERFQSQRIERNRNCVLGISAFFFFFFFILAFLNAIPIHVPRASKTTLNNTVS